MSLTLINKRFSVNMYTNTSYDNKKEMGVVRL